MIHGLHPKGLRGAFAWTRTEAQEKLDGLIKPDTLLLYLAQDTSKRYLEPPAPVKVTCYAVFKHLVEIGEPVINEKAIEQFLTQF